MTPRRYGGAACVLVAAVVATVLAFGKPTFSDDQVAIGHAISVLEHTRATRPGEWTKSGKPRVDAIERLLGRDISAAQRDRAWKARKNPTPPPEAVPAIVQDPDLAAKLAAAERARDDLIVTRKAQEDAHAALELERDGWRSRAASAESTLASLQASFDSRVATARRDARAAERQYNDLMAAAERDRKAAANARSGATTVLREAESEARQMRADAAALLRDAQAREAGSGPPASRACASAIDRVFSAGWTWPTGNLKTNRDDVATARAVCFEQR